MNPSLLEPDADMVGAGVQELGDHAIDLAGRPTNRLSGEDVWQLLASAYDRICRK